LDAYGWTLLFERDHANQGIASLAGTHCGLSQFGPCKIRAPPVPCPGCTTSTFAPLLPCRSV
jgi:hypothetical protein